MGATKLMIVWVDTQRAQLDRSRGEWETPSVVAQRVPTREVFRFALLACRGEASNRSTAIPQLVVRRSYLRMKNRNEKLETSEYEFW